MKRLLNVGGFSKEIPLPPQYDGWEHVLLDIDDRNSPDIVCDARELSSLPAGEYDSVYCAHNLEHFYRHEVQTVLRGFRHILKPAGFAWIAVPDLHQVMQHVLARNLDIDDVLYQSAVGPIRALDVFYGLASQIEHHREPWWGHKTGFTHKSLLKAIERAGFKRVYSTALHLEVRAIAFTQKPDQETMELLELKSDQEYSPYVSRNHDAETAQPPQKGSDTRQC